MDFTSNNECKCNCNETINELSNQIKFLKQTVDKLKNEIEIIVGGTEKIYLDMVSRKTEVISILSTCEATIPNGVELRYCKEIINILADYISRKTNTIEDAKNVSICFNNFVRERGISYGMVSYAIDIHWSKYPNYNFKFRYNNFWKILSYCLKLTLDYYYKNILII